MPGPGQYFFCHETPKVQHVLNKFVRCLSLLHALSCIFAPSFVFTENHNLVRMFISYGSTLFSHVGWTERKILKRLRRFRHAKLFLRLEFHRIPAQQTQVHLRLI